MKKNIVYFIFTVFMSLLIISCSQTAVKTEEKEEEIQQEQPREIVFMTEGSSFAPVITVTGTPQILWTWADGTTSNSASPIKEYGTAVSRINRLIVTPWSAVQTINIGYGAQDGGNYWDTLKELNPVYLESQRVSNIQGLEAVAPYLVGWYSSYYNPLNNGSTNLITSLNFSNFTKLARIECFNVDSLTSINLGNTPALERLCVETCSLPALDISQSAKLEDLRGAINDFPNIIFGAIGAHTWHICVRDNPQLTNRYLFANMNQFPQIAELFIWNNNQTGALNISSTSSNMFVSIWAQENKFTSANFTGAFQNENSSGEINLNSNSLTGLIITGCDQITYLSAANNNLNAASVDLVLQTLDGLGRTGGNVILTGNAPPSAAGQTAITNLRDSKGWTVSVDTE